MNDDNLQFIDLASERMGASVLAASDEFFAPKERLLLPSEAIFIPDKYVPTGKWMDGWETRRRRTPGHDWCVIRLGARGSIDRVVVDTSHFRGNYPAECLLEGCDHPSAAAPEDLLDAEWHPVVPRNPLAGNSKNPFSSVTDKPVTHLRFSIFPDGGVARLRVLGRAVPDWDRTDATGELCDLAGARAGGRILGASDMFFGHARNLLSPDRALDMSDGWETERRRGPGHDWVVVELGARGRILRAEIDTLHFKGNAPGRGDIDVCDRPGTRLDEISETDWQPLLTGGPLRSHELHRFDDALTPRLWATHARLRIHPDGGVSRLRLWGRTERSAAVLQRMGAFNQLPDAEAEALLLKCCASTSWAAAVADARPYACLSELFAVGDRVWRALGEDDWKEAFAAHPRIGDRSEGWSQGEQSGIAGAEAATLSELAAKNKAYEDRFGHVFLICATGKSADEMLGAATARLNNSAAEELANAAEEQRKITHLRLFKGLTQ